MMGELVEKTVGHKMKIHLRIEVDQKISKENLEKVQQILKDIDEDMDLRIVLLRLWRGGGEVGLHGSGSTDRLAFSPIGNIAVVECKLDTK